MSALVPALLALVDADCKAAAPGTGAGYVLATRHLVGLLKAHSTSFKAVTDQLSAPQRAQLEKALREALAAAASPQGPAAAQSTGQHPPARRGGGISLRTFGS